jgi:two-component system, NtrC family, response regulator GlrR
MKRRSGRISPRFEGRGHEVGIAESGSQALALISAKDGIDLVLTDYRMAEMNGCELVRLVKDRAPDVMVILMTAYGRN